MPDDALLLALRSGDKDALATLFELHADRVYRLAMSLLRDPAESEDVLQETFLAAMTHLDRFEGRSGLGTWLYRIAYNASLDHLRRRREDRLPPEDSNGDSTDIPMPRTFVEWGQTPEALLANAEARIQLDQAVGELPDTLRAVFVLRDIEELSTEETAETMGISPGAVKVRLHRARLILRERLSGYFAKGK